MYLGVCHLKLFNYKKHRVHLSYRDILQVDANTYTTTYLRRYYIDNIFDRVLTFFATKSQRATFTETETQPSRRSSPHGQHRKLPYLTTLGAASDENLMKETFPPRCFSASWHIESIKTFELCCIISLTHKGLCRMANILQATFSYLFSFDHILCSFIKLSAKFVPIVLLAMSQHWFRQWLGTAEAASHLLSPHGPGYWRMDASLGLGEVTGRYINGSQSLITHKSKLWFTDIEIKITNIRKQGQRNIGSHIVCALLWFYVSKLALKQT